MNKDTLKKEKILIDKKWDEVYTNCLKNGVDKEKVLDIIKRHNSIAKQIIQKGWTDIL